MFFTEIRGFYMAQCYSMKFMFYKVIYSFVLFLLCWRLHLNCIYTSNTTGATCGADRDDPSGAHENTVSFWWNSCCSVVGFLCLVLCTDVLLVVIFDICHDFVSVVVSLNIPLEFLPYLSSLLLNVSRHFILFKFNANLFICFPFLNFSPWTVNLKKYIY